jgi:hypothetical protein
MNGLTVTRLLPDGTETVLASNLLLTAPMIDAKGDLWGVTADSTQLARVTPAGEVSRIALPVQPHGQSIVGTLPASDGGLWLIRWDQEKRQTDAIRIKEGAVAETLLLMPTRTHGNDAMPVRIGLAREGGAWIARQKQTGPTEWESTALYRFDLATGAFRPALAPQGVEGPLQLAGTTSQGALLVDATGKFWTVAP